MYSAEISRANPSAFLFVIDQSGSMDELMPTGDRKSKFVSDVLNRTIYQLAIRCNSPEGVRNYFDVGVISYGARIGSGFSGALAGQILYPLSTVSDNPLRIEDRVKRVPDGAGGLVEQGSKFPVWFEPAHAGGTPMRSALDLAVGELAEWCRTHPNSYPPTVIHVTDGEFSPADGDPAPVAESLKGLATGDGNCLLFNLHISVGGGEEVVFPSTANGLDRFGQVLFAMSSPLPRHLVEPAKARGYVSAGPESRFFGYRAGFEAIVDFFEIGSRAANMR